MKKIILSLTVALLLSTSTALLWGQNPEWKAYSGGLSKVQQIIDNGDYLWIATLGGLVKFNKYSHESTVYDKTNSDLPSYLITDMAMDSDNTLWMITDKGLTRFDGNTWNTFTPDNSPLPSIALHALAVQDKNVWVATYKGVAHYNGLTWKIFEGTKETPWLNRVGKLHIDNNGSVLASYGDTVYAYTGTTWASVSVLPQGVSSIIDISNARNATWILGKKNDARSNFLVSSTNGNWQTHDINILNTHTITAMLIHDNAMWFATKSDTVFYYHNSHWQTYSVQLEKDVLFNKDEDERITTMRIDSDGMLWCGTNASRLLRFGNNTWATVSYTPIYFAPTRPQSLYLSSIAVDTDQSLWFGYTCLRPVPFLTHFTGAHWYNDPLPNRTDLLAVDSKGRKWSASNDGLWKLENNQWQDVLTGDFLSLYIDRSDNIWLGTKSGVVQYDHKRRREYAPHNSGIVGSVHSIVQDQTGAMWFAAEEGINSFNGATWETYTHDNVPALYEPRPSALTCDSNNVLWIGMQGSSNLDTTGLVSFDGTTWTTYTQYNSPLPNNGVRTLLTDKKGALWIVSHAGLTKVENGTWTTFTSDNSPFPLRANISLYTECLAVDAYNNLWIGISTVKGGTILLTYREGGVLVGVEQQPKPIREPALLAQNSPNPASARTNIRYPVPQNTTTMPVRLQLFNALGIPIATLANEYKTSGTYIAEFDTSTLPSGTYYYQLTVGSTTQAKQMLVVK